ncbi:MAG: glutamate cyclase domain-containing protein [Candidatus Methylomirabilales bacterium]
MIRGRLGARAADLLDCLLLSAPPADRAPAGAPPRDAGAAAGPALLELYAEARRRTGQPLAARAALALDAALRSRRPAILTTGLVTPRIPRGETDGPPGAAVLARALALAAGVEVRLLTEPPVMPVQRAALDALARGEGDGAAWRDRVQLEAFPADLPAARAAARQLWAALDPAAVVAVEKLGPNGRGVIHTMRGEDVTARQARTDVLFGGAARRGVLRVGVGDRGNEIGMGGLLRAGRRCLCGCGGSIACTTRADAPVVAHTSNWGSYGIVAALAAAHRRPDLLHRPAAEARMLRAIVRAGARDGVTRRATLSVDGGALALQTALVAALRALVRAAGPA